MHSYPISSLQVQIVEIIWKIKKLIYNLQLFPAIVCWRPHQFSDGRQKMASRQNKKWNKTKQKMGMVFIPTYITFTWYMNTKTMRGESKIYLHRNNCRNKLRLILASRSWEINFPRCGGVVVYGVCVAGLREIMAIQASEPSLS